MCEVCEYIRFSFISEIEYIVRKKYHGALTMALTASETACTATNFSQLDTEHALGIGPRNAVYVDSPFFRRAAYGTNHPLAIPRTETVNDLCRALDWLPDQACVESEPAPIATLSRFHDLDYLQSLLACDQRGAVSREERERYQLGTMENPVFPGVFERAATAVGGSIKAAELALTNHLAFHPAGGTHHGRASQASGFCYMNDPVFAILTLLDAGLERILYVDIDAHHGDGVEAAFENDPRVYLFSIHEANRWPYSGATAQHQRLRNVAVSPGCDDRLFQSVIRRTGLEFAAQIKPEAVVITCGADALAGDPLSTMKISNESLWQTTEAFIARAERAVVLGGGGYNPWTVARCWTGLWGLLGGFELPTKLPAEAQKILTALECDLVDDDEIPTQWIDSLRDKI